MTFDATTYANMVSERSETQRRVFPQYRGARDDFDIVIVGSGVGGGVLADSLADRLGDKRILVIEAGSFLFPTHVYNVCHFPNTDLAHDFACKTFWQAGNGDNGGTQNYIHEQPQLNFGGRSIFWSGLIPHLQDWELDFFPPAVRDALKARFLDDAGERMNQSVTLGTTANAVVQKLRASDIGDDFVVVETPRALHQPYLQRDGTPRGSYYIEPTGVFNTAELLINQTGQRPADFSDDGAGLFLMLNNYVEDIRALPGDRFELVLRDTLTGQARMIQAGTAVLAGGSIESPKLLRRSSLFPSLPAVVQAKAGLGLTDHPTTSSLFAAVTNIGDVAIPRDSMAKIMFYSRGRRDAANQISFPFNVEMNINHEYWHLREDDPTTAAHDIFHAGSSIVDIKFSFGNCLDDANQIKDPPPFGYVPEIVFKNQHWLDHLRDSRFPALAGWQKSYEEIFAVLNGVTDRIFRQFQNAGDEARPERESWYGQDQHDFGFGTVHHAVGTLRMPYRSSYKDGPHFDSVVDEDLRVRGTKNLYVCDMSVIPFASAANPVRTLVGLALRLSELFG